MRGRLYGLWWRTRLPAVARGRQPYFREALQIIRRHDPEGLMDLGAPPDEYAPEAEDFARLLASGASITPEVTRDVWEGWFGPGSGFVEYGGPAAIAALAQELQDLRRGG